MTEQAKDLGGESPFSEAETVRFEILASQKFPGADVHAANELNYHINFYTRLSESLSNQPDLEVKRTAKQLITGSVIVGGTVAGANFDLVPYNLAVLTVIGGLFALVIRTAGPMYDDDRTEPYYLHEDAQNRLDYLQKLVQRRDAQSGVVE